MPEAVETLLECAYRGVGEARIDIAFGAAGEPRRRLGCILEHEAGGQIHRLRMLAELAAVDAGAQGKGIEFDLIGHDCVHIAGPQLKSFCYGPI
jgi:hypothetical protein